MESKEKQSSVPMLCCVVGGFPVGWAASKLDRCSKSHSKQAHFLSPGLENIQSLEIGNGMKSDNHRKTQPTFRTHWILPSSKVSFFSGGKKMILLHLLFWSCQLGNWYWIPPISHYSGTRTHRLSFLFRRKKSRVRKANSGIDFSTVPTCNPIHVFR